MLQMTLPMRRVAGLTVFFEFKQEPAASASPLLATKLVALGRTLIQLLLYQRFAELSPYCCFYC